MFSCRKVHFPTEKMHFPAEKCGFLQKMHFSGGHRAGNCRKLREGFWAQESRTLPNFHKTSFWLVIWALRPHGRLCRGSQCYTPPVSFLSLFPPPPTKYKTFVSPKTHPKIHPQSSPETKIQKNLQRLRKIPICVHFWYYSYLVSGGDSECPLGCILGLSGALYSVGGAGDCKFGMRAPWKPHQKRPTRVRYFKPV